MSGGLNTAVTSSMTTGQQQLPTASTHTSPLCDSEFMTPLPLRDRDQQLGGTKHQLKRTILSGETYFHESIHRIHRNIAQK